MTLIDCMCQEKNEEEDSQMVDIKIQRVEDSIECEKEDWL